MDGFAVRSADTVGAMTSTPISLDYPDRSVYVDTGDPLPEWADAVIPIENVEPVNSTGSPASNPRQPEVIRIRSAITPWSHVRPLGEDIVATQLVLPAGQRLRPVDLGAMAACGHDRLRVARRPRVAILPTGSELVPIGESVEPGEIIEYNSVVLASQVISWGGEVTRFKIIPDDMDRICDQVALAAQEHDLILLLAGSSAGSEDYSSRVVEKLGKLLVHGVAIRPGHPVILGMIDQLERHVPVIGVPGYPVSAALTGEIFVQPLIAMWLGLQPEEPTTITATLTRKVTSPAGDDDYLRVAVGRVGERLLAAPLSRGAGVITSLVRADGIAILPRGTQGMAAGDPVQVRLYRTPAQIERTFFVIGSHDITLDLIAQYLAELDYRLSSSNVGSLAGLVAIGRREAHLAGAHLLDPQSGEYNLPYIHQYIPGIPVKVIALVGRQQGLLVRKGNFKGIQSLNDLTRSDVVFVNRQRGAGTRVLLDYHFSLLGIAPDAVRGYNQEEYTHLSVAAAVASGRADCGLGIAAAAEALELDFIPLYQERYDLIIPLEYDHSSLISPIYQIIDNPTFRRAVASLPGYDVSIMGQQIAVIE
jgi:putative molybdopterin biosynthesis protein